MNGDKQKKQKKHKKQQKKRISKIFFKTFFITISMLLVLVFAVVFIFVKTNKPPVVAGGIYIGEPDLSEIAYFHPEADLDDMLIGNGFTAPESFTKEDRKDLFYTFLIFGIDNGYNTDTIMVASYDGVSKEANIIGIPRDSMVNVKRSIKKINAAYGAGTQNGGGRDGGIAQLQREIKTIIGFVPDYYVMINFKAFVQLIDAIDGVDVNVPFHMLYDDEYQDLYINIPKGDQHLNGADALKFARYRNGNDKRYTITDFQRIQNQQAVIKSVLSKLLNPVYLLKIPEFIDIFNENVYTNISLKHMLWFADQLNSIVGSDALSTHTIPITGNSGYPTYWEYIDEGEMVRLVNDTINPYKKYITISDVDIIND